MNKSIAAAALLALLAPVASFAQLSWVTTSDAKLLQIDLSNPSTILESHTITGLRGAGGVSSDPFGYIQDLTQVNGTLYGLDRNANFYWINGTTGAANFIGSAFSPVGFDGGLAHDPFTNNFRFVSDASENVQISFSGAVTNGNATFYAPEDVNAASVTTFVALGIDSDFGTGYAIDSATGSLAVTIDPNFEEFFTVGSLGLNISGLAGLDVYQGALYAALSEDAFLSSFYSIDATTGAATLVGNFDGGITGLAVIPEPSTYAALLGAVALAVAAYRRRRSA